MKQILLGTLLSFTCSAVFSQELIADTPVAGDSVSRLAASPEIVTRTMGPDFYGTNITRALDGRFAGLQSANGGGQPGASAALMLRGYSTIDRDNAPLIIVDGFPFTGDIGTIDPQDIESVEVLKDAVAAFAYTASGNANGVIKIVTKKGREHKRLNVDARAGISTAALQSYKTVNEQQYYELAFDALKNAALASGIPEAAAGQEALSYLVPYLRYNAYDVPDNQLIDPVTGKLNPAAKLKQHDSWQKESRRVGLYHGYSLSFENKNDKSDYRLSSGYTNEQGYIINTGYERLNLRLDASHRFLPWLKAGINVSGALTSQAYTNSNDISSFNPALVAQAMPPIYPVYYRNAAGDRERDPVTGDYKYDFTSGRFGGSTNAIAAQKYRENIWKTRNLVLLPYIRLGFLKNFSFTASFNLNYFTAENDNSVSRKFEPLVLPFKHKGKYDGTSYMVRGELAWAKRLKDHKININLVSNYQRNATNIKDLMVADSGLGYRQYYDKQAMLLFTMYTTADYSFKEKYYMSGGISYTDNGSSTMYHGPGSFTTWSAGLGWMLSNEGFLADNRVFDKLKIRAGYGNVLRKASTGFSNDIYPNVFFGDKKQNYLNGGVDFTLAGDRVSGAVDLYRRTGWTDLPPNLQVGTPYPKPGYEMSNTGIDVTLQFELIRKEQAGWSLSLVAGSYSNTIIKMPPGLDSILNSSYLLTKGLPKNTFFIPESAGVDPANGNELWYYTNAAGQKAKTRDYQLTADVNSRVNAGNPTPVLFGGVQNSVYVGKFDFYLNLTFGLGGKIYDQAYAFLMMNNQIGTNYSVDILDRWTPGNTSSGLPKMNVDAGRDGPSTRFVKDASYLNIRAISIGYNILDKLKRRDKALKSARIYFTCDNLWLFSAKRGMNPQANFDGVNDFVYAPARTVLAGVSVGL